MRLIYTSSISTGDKLSTDQSLLEVMKPLAALAQKGIISLLSITSVGDSFYLFCSLFLPQLISCWPSIKLNLLGEWTKMITKTNQATLACRECSHVCSLAFFKCIMDAKCCPDYNPLRLLVSFPQTCVLWQPQLSREINFNWSFIWSLPFSSLLYVLSRSVESQFYTLLFFSFSENVTEFE